MSQILAKKSESVLEKYGRAFFCRKMTHIFSRIPQSNVGSRGKMERSSVNIFALITAATTFLLILAGSLVTSTGSGLAVPDWPLSFGQLFPNMEGGILFEHSHRMIAGIVLILTTILTVWLWRSDGKSKASILATIALVLVLIQALLGGITVLYGLPPLVSIIHALIAQTFFCLMVWIAFLTSPLDLRTVARGDRPQSFRTLSITLFLLIFAQLLFGASFRHGLGIRPLYIHILNGFLVGGVGVAISLYIGKRFKENRTIYRTGMVLLSLIFAQMFLGIASVASFFGSEIFLSSSRLLILTLHIGVGALILAASLVLSLLIYHE